MNTINQNNRMKISFETAESLKHQFASVNENPTEAVPSHTTQATLPDGTEIQLSDEMLSFPEQFFHSGTGDYEVPLQSIVAKQLMRYITAKTKKPTLLISGGCAKMKGFVQRIKYELQNYSDEHHPQKHPLRSLNIEVSADPINDAWQGGAILASIADYLPVLSLSKADYEESGETALYQKFEATNVLV